MAQNPDDIVLPGNFRFYTATVGTTLPDENDIPTLGNSNLPSGWNETGYTTIQGTRLTTDKTVNPIEVHQSALPPRYSVSGLAASFITNFREWNAQTFLAAFGGGQVTEPAPGVYKFTPPDPSQLNTFSAVADFFDGTKYARFVLASVFVGSGVTINLDRDNAADLGETTFQILEPGGGVDAWSLYTNIEGFEPVGS